MSKLQDWENKIICGDCLELMKQLPDGCVDLVVTDPPFFVPLEHYASRVEKWKRNWGDLSPLQEVLNF